MNAVCKSNVDVRLKQRLPRGYYNEMHLVRPWNGIHKYPAYMKKELIKKNAKTFKTKEVMTSLNLFENWKRDKCLIHATTH